MAFARLIGACLILLGLSGPVYGECISPAVAIEKLKAVAAFVVADLKGEAAQPVVEAYNSAEPKTDTKADRVIIFYKERHPLVTIGIFNLGCAVGTMFPTVESFLAVFPQYRERLQRLAI